MKRHPLVRRCVRALLLAALCGWAAAVAPTANAWSAPALLPGIPNDVRDPKIAADGARFHVVFKRQASRELFYSRGVASANGAIAWQPPQLLAGDVANGWNVSARAGVVHVAYAGGDRRVRYLRNAAAGDVGAWAAPETVATVPEQVNELELTLDAVGTPYAQWGQDVDRSVLAYAYRSDAGAWVARTLANDAYFYRNGAIVVSGSGPGAVVHIISEVKREVASRLAIVYARGTRDGAFDISDFSRPYVGSAIDASEPTLGIDRTTGALFASFFSGKDSQFDLSFTYSTTNGQSWAPATSDPLGGDLVVTDKSPIVGFPGGAYLLLNVKRIKNGGFVASGFYLSSFSLQNPQFSPPTPVRPLEGADAKNVSPDFAVNQVAKGAVWVTGFTENIAYSGDPGGRPSDDVPSATLSVNGGAAAFANPLLTITLTNIVGAPTQMQVAFDGTPDANTPVEPFQATFTRAAPSAPACARSIALVLIDAGGARSNVLRASFVLDTAVQARVAARNPFKRSNLVLVADSTGANDGDDAYTRKQSMYVEVDASAECTSLKQVRIGSSQDTLGGPFPATGALFANVLPLPGGLAPGASPVAVAVTDAVGNTRLFTTTLVYDPVAPVLATTGTLTPSVPASAPNIFATLAFSGSVVTDNLYPGRGFWGVWLANSRTPVANPATDASLAWVAVAAPGEAANVTIAGWNLLNGIAPANQTPGEYIVYARFLDGAGNPSQGVVEGRVTLTSVLKPTVYLPLVAR